MFEFISDVPAPIAKYYTEEVRNEPSFDDNGRPIMTTEQYEYEDENGQMQTGTREVQLFEDVTYVVLVSFGETKLMTDVHRVIEKKKGKNDDLIVSFLEMHNNHLHQTFHGKYIDWMKSESDDNEPELHLIDIDGWFLDNYMLLRKAAYPEISEQNDIQYHDMANGTNIWFETITEVKERYPKP